MKNVLLKFAGLFVERVPVDEHGNPLPPPVPGPNTTPAQPAMPQAALPAAPAMPAMPAMPSQAGASSVSVALRAWVPQEHAAHLAQFGVHVIAAGGSITSEQALGWGAQALIVSAECLGTDTQLLHQPQLPTLFITPQPMMIPEVPGVVQVQEPLRASDVAGATREAIAAFAATRR